MGMFPSTCGSTTMALTAPSGTWSWMRAFPKGDEVAGAQGGDHVVGREMVGPQPIGVEVDDDRADVAAQRRRRRDAGDAAEDRPDPEQREVGDLADAPRLVAIDDQVADGHVAGIVAEEERGQRARGHEAPGPDDVADRLGHRLGHVGAGVEEELDNGHPLDILRLDVVDAGHVERVALVVGSDLALHLARVHAAVGLGDVDDRQVEGGEDVDRPCAARRGRWQPPGPPRPP